MIFFLQVVSTLLATLVYSTGCPSGALVASSSTSLQSISTPTGFNRASNTALNVTITCGTPPAIHQAGVISFTPPITGDYQILWRPLLVDDCSLLETMQIFSGTCSALVQRNCTSLIGATPCIGFNKVPLTGGITYRILVGREDDDSLEQGTLTIARVTPTSAPTGSFGPPLIQIFSPLYSLSISITIAVTLILALISGSGALAALVLVLTGKGHRHLMWASFATQFLIFWMVVASKIDVTVGINSVVINPALIAFNELIIITVFEQTIYWAMLISFVLLQKESEKISGEPSGVCVKICMYTMIFILSLISIFQFVGGFTGLGFIGFAVYSFTSAAFWLFLSFIFCSFASKLGNVAYLLIIPLVSLAIMNLVSGITMFGVVPLLTGSLEAMNFFFVFVEILFAFAVLTIALKLKPKEQFQQVMEGAPVQSYQAYDTKNPRFG